MNRWIPIAVALAVGIGIVFTPAVLGGEPPRMRDLDLLDDDLRARLQAFLDAATAQGHPLTVLETFRTPERQAWLYAKGRTTPGPIVTKTQQSAHLTGDAVDVWPAGVGFDAAGSSKALAVLNSLAPLMDANGLKRPALSFGDAGHLEAA